MSSTGSRCSPKDSLPPDTSRPSSRAWVKPSSALARAASTCGARRSPACAETRIAPNPLARTVLGLGARPRIARRQQAKSNELRVATSLARPCGIWRQEANRDDPSRPLHLRAGLHGPPPAVPPGALEATWSPARRGAGGGGRTQPDGAAANIFYRVADRAELARLLEDNEFNRAGLFTANHPRAFSDFLDPTDRPPLDAGLQATIVEGAPPDRTRARAALATLQRMGQVAFGGFFEDGGGLAVVRSSRLDEAVTWLVEAGWERPRLSARPWSQTL